MEIQRYIYSDGEIEDELIETLKEQKDVYEIPYNGGAVFHNFTDARENLITWYPFKKDAVILEIGAGMGALTGVLGRSAKKVVALEQSVKRAEIIRERYQNSQNIDVICGDLLSYEPEVKFDYITLIGVLEYVGIGTSSKDPYVDFLKKIKSLLKEDGILLLAIENRFGLKYWCGAAEDHTSIPFDGISGYESSGYTTRYNKDGVKTFSKNVLSEKLQASGFDQTRWYYPLPDYKFPAAIFSDDYLPQVEDIAAIKFGYPVESLLIANEKRLYKEIIENGEFPFFANSFLVECSSKDLSSDSIIYASFKRDYKAEYRVATLFNDEKKVLKQAITSKAISHIDEIETYTKEIAKCGVPIVPLNRNGDMLEQEWQDIPRADFVFKEYLRENNLTKVYDIINTLKENLLKTSASYNAKDVKVANQFKVSFANEETILEYGYCDMTFVNSFIKNKELIFFDQEWKFVNIPLKYILYRAVKYAYEKNGTNISLDRIYVQIGIDAEMQNVFAEIEKKLLNYMMDEYKCKMFDPNMYHEGLCLNYQLSEKQKRIDVLQIENNNQKGHIEQLLEAERNYRNELNDKEKNIEQLLKEEDAYKKKIVEKEESIEQLLKTEDVYKRKIVEKEKTIVEKEEKIHELLKVQREYQDAKQTIRNKEGHIEQLLEVEREYEREKKSKTYRLALKLRKISVALLPVNSKRRFFVKVLVKAIRHPLLTIKMINPRRLKNCVTILKTEGVESAQNHYRLVEEYEKSRSIPLDNQNLSIEKVNENAKNFEEYQKLQFTVYENPQVSIVIPVYNQFDYTYHCLESILNNSGDCTYEVIIANDCSTDLTQRIEEIVEGVTVITNKHNLRFLLNCNNAAKRAKGEYILFLNNDTQVQENWLKPLVDLIESNSKIGMVGAKLIYADGYLQEAGGILWKDASAWNYGHRQNPNDSEFSYVHEVDYISGAAMMIRAELWKEIGGFDERFVPAYCEDSDLAFEVRKHGYKVLLQPKSVVVHFEGISNGTDVTSGQKKYQVENQKKFYEKWKNELEATHFDNGTHVFLARERSRDQKHVLVIDHYVPQYDKDAGSKTTFMYLKMLVNKGYKITFLGDNFYQHEPYTSELQQLGILVLYGPKYAEGWKEWLEENIQYFDVFYLNRPHISVKYIDFIKERARGKIIYYGHDLHFLRLKREYEISGEERLLKESEDWLEKELYLMRRADISYYPSQVEVEEIHKIDANISVKAITAYVYDRFRDVTYNAHERNGLLFVGGFGHGPNVDAVLWFLDKIYPEIYRNTGAPFYIVGSKAPEEITNIKQDGVIVKGFVSEEELQELYNTCRIAVVPLRYGAGVKGKVVEALYYGIPIATTSVGAEGITGIEDIVAVKDSEAELICSISELYNDSDRLKQMSCKSQEYIHEHFGMEAVWSIIENDFN